MGIGVSGEDYLEAILILKKRGGSVRNVELASFMGYAKPSITYAVKELKKHGLVEKTEDGDILLTEVGNRIAVKIYERHCFFHDFLCEAGIDERTAQREACRMEHTVTEESFQKLKERYKDLKNQTKEDVP
ncbi:Transcriptional regulator MntR [Blautia producta]|uniref:Transcriptional regulator MntR n=1 Tax=Blautia producta TaxID=33035 RepID=A0A4P6LSH2_9FIRM|nr:metal-dependent transcriptional regulator [Blautia producta]QBE95144.1 Transcriptional regulator MntR [Blautia producta]